MLLLAGCCCKLTVGSYTHAAAGAGGPLCQGSLSIQLAHTSRQQLAAVLQGTASTAQLLRQYTSSYGSVALYPLVWLLRGDLCNSKPLRSGDAVRGSGGSSGRAGGGDGILDWASQWVACNASLLPQPEAAPTIASTGSGTGVTQQRRLTADNSRNSDIANWWRLDCWAVNASGAPIERQGEAGTAECSADFSGPRCAGAAACWMAALHMPAASCAKQFLISLPHTLSPAGWWLPWSVCRAA